MVGKRKKIDAETTINKMMADMGTKMKEVLMGVKKKKKKSNFLYSPFRILRTISCCFTSCLRTVSDYDL